MCLLTFLPRNVQPREDYIRNGTINNRDGHGYAIALPDRLIVRRFMFAEQAIDAFMRERSANPDGPAIFHSRFGTAGSVTEDNVHPYAVGGDWRTVLAHNGVFDESVQPSKGDPRSDTRVLADMLTVDDVRYADGRKRIADWATKSNKLAILTCDKRFRRQGYILNAGSGIWVDGIWYSNRGYLDDDYYCWPTRASKRSVVYDMERDAYREWHYDEEKGFYVANSDANGVDYCGNCDSVLTGRDWDLGECGRCGWCTECESMPVDCVCYIPESARAVAQAESEPETFDRSHWASGTGYGDTAAALQASSPEDRRAAYALAREANTVPGTPEWRALIADVLREMVSDHSAHRELTSAPSDQTER